MLYEPEAVVKIIEENRPIRRRFRFSLMRVRVLHASTVAHGGGYILSRRIRESGL